MQKKRRHFAVQRFSAMKRGGWPFAGSNLLTGFRATFAVQRPSSTLVLAKTRASPAPWPREAAAGSRFGWRSPGSDVCRRSVCDFSDFPRRPLLLLAKIRAARLCPLHSRSSSALALQWLLLAVVVSCCSPLLAAAGCCCLLPSLQSLLADVVAVAGVCL